MRRAAAVALAAVIGASIAPPAARAALDVTRGLTTQSFTNQNQSGTRAFGYLTVFREGLYRFELRPSAGTVQVDGSTAPEINLARGSHFVLVEIAHQGDRPSFELMWASRDQTEVAPVPAWQLSRERVPVWKLLAVRILEWVRAVAVLLAAALVGWRTWLRAREPLIAGTRLHPRRATFGAFALLAVAHTWPLATSPATLSRYDNSDAMLNEWTIAWVAHQIVRDPMHLFDANVFFPERNTLAFSEAMLVQGVLGAPLLWLGAPTLLVYNLVLLAGFTLTGWATCLVAARWTGSWTAGGIAGITAAFNAHTLTRLPHLQALHVEFFPLALAALDSLLRAARTRHALTLAGWFVLQSLTSIYLLVLTAVAMMAAAAVRPREWLGRRLGPVGGRLVLAGAISVAALWPYLQAYWHVHQEHGVTRTLFDVELYSASWRDYLSSPSRIHLNAWSHWLYSGTPLFPGLVPIGLAAIAIFCGRAWRDSRARMCLAFGICGVVLSFGIKIPGYAWLFEILTPLQAVRAVSRFGYLGIAAVAFLAAFGLAELQSRLPPHRWRITAATLLILAAIEPMVAPIQFRSFAGVSRIYEALATERHAVVVELPMPGGFGWFGNARYMINSTRHWRPLLNGYSGFAPASFHEHTRALATFPQPEAITALETIGVTHAFVQIDGYTAEQHAMMAASPRLSRVASNEWILLYRVNATADQPR
jgi:hypothetical protein